MSTSTCSCDLAQGNHRFCTQFVEIQCKYGSQKRQKMNCSSRYKGSPAGGGNIEIYCTIVLLKRWGMR
jgi:hypothetical protein